MAHIHDQIDFVVSVFIVHDDKVLMIFHKKIQRWLPIGGHVELDEDTDQALFREVEEECGLKIKLLREKPPQPKEAKQSTKTLHAPDYMDIHRYTPDGSHRHIVLIYFAVSESNEVRLAAEEHEDIRWLSRADLDNPKYGLDSIMHFYASEALDRAADYRKSNLEKFKKTLQ